MRPPRGSAGVFIDAIDRSQVPDRQRDQVSGSASHDKGMRTEQPIGWSNRTSRKSFSMYQFTGSRIQHIQHSLGIHRIDGPMVYVGIADIRPGPEGPENSFGTRIQRIQTLGQARLDINDTVPCGEGRVVDSGVRRIVPAHMGKQGW